jgi:hypothetical protein
MILVEIETVAAGREPITILPGKEAEVALYFYVDRKGAYEVLFEIGYMMQMRVEERHTAERSRRIILE